MNAGTHTHTKEEGIYLCFIKQQPDWYSRVYFFSRKNYVHYIIGILQLEKYKHIFNTKYVVTNRICGKRK